MVITSSSGSEYGKAVTKIIVYVHMQWRSVGV